MNLKNIMAIYHQKIYASTILYFHEEYEKAEIEIKEIFKKYDEIKEEFSNQTWVSFRSCTR